jgi:2-dehydropantoate 2-reductase
MQELHRNELQMSRPEFAILGAGAIGSIIGAHLARAGHSVTMLARGRRAQQLQADGLRIKGLTEFSVTAQVQSDPSQFRGADVLIVATKTPGTAAALEALRAADIGVAFSLQNGLWKNEALAQAFGAQRVLGALANTSGELLPSGEVLFTRNVNVFIGELGGGLSERAQRIAHMIDASGVRSTAVPDILSREWAKFVGWVGLMTMAVTTRAATWRYLADPGCAVVLVRLVREMLALAKASGVRLSEQDAILPLNAIANGSESEAVASVRRAGEDFKARAPEHRMSTLQDLEAGRPLEVEETLGYAVRKASALGVPVPLLDAFYHLVTAIDRGRSGS